MTDTDDAPKPKPKRMRWSDRPKLSPDAAGRQGRVTKLALETLGRDAAIAYLNADCGNLGGRPLDVAMESAEGFGRVERDLQAKVAG